MATEKEGMVNGSSSTSRVSSNFILARTAPLVHCTACRRFYFLQMHSRGGIFIVGEWRTQRFGECKGEQSPFPDMELILMIWFCVHSQIGLEAGTTLGISGSAPAVRF